MSSSLSERIRRIAEAGLADEEIEVVARQASGTEKLEKVVVDALRHAYAAPARLAYQRWLRRAAEDHQLWALWEAGQYCVYRAIDDDGAVITAADVDAWLAKAADRGHRGAALLAARSGGHEGSEYHRTLTWLTCAYGDGTASPEHDIAQSEVYAAAALQGRLMQQLSPDLAEAWYRRALSEEGWQEPDSQYSTDYYRVATEFALWKHTCGDVGTCEQWCRVLTDEATREEWGDRLTLCEEAHKPWRDDYTAASFRSNLRAMALEHRLDEHELSAAEYWRSLRALTDTFVFERDRREQSMLPRVRAALRQVTSVATRSGIELGAEALARVQAGDAWLFVEWQLQVALPIVFEEAGLVAEANELWRLAPSADALNVDPFAHSSAVVFLDEEPGFTAPDYWADVPDPLDAVEQAPARFVLQQLALDRERESPGAVPVRYRQRPALANVLENTGFCGCLDEEFHVFALAESYGGKFRFLRGEPLWFAFWEASRTAEDEGDWMAVSDRAGGLLFAALQESLVLQGAAGMRSTEERLRAEFTAFLGRLNLTA